MRVSDMTFFHTSEGGLHMLRIAGVIYVVALVPGCRGFLSLEPLCLMRIMFTAGWWLCFCGKRPGHTLSDILHPLGILGSILMVLGIAGEFYFAGHK